MHSASQRVLVLGAASNCSQILRNLQFEVQEAGWPSPGLEILAAQEFDLAFLSLSAPGNPGLDAFHKARSTAPRVPFILLGRPGDEGVCAEALRLGAQDYFIEPEPGAAALAGAIPKAILRHHALEVSRQDQHLLEILMNKIPDAIYFKDVDSRFLRISRAHARRFNLGNPALALGKTDADFFTAAHAQAARADERRVMTTGLPMVGVEEMETWPDGTISWVSTTKLPLRDPAGKITGTFGISRDITSRKEAETFLSERTRQLRQKNEQMEGELKMARQLQLAMLPHKFPRVQTPGARGCSLEFFSVYEPMGQVSGDFFDVIELSDAAVGLFMCDVMGHDVRAALVTAMMRSLVEDLSQPATEPGQLLAQINHALAGVFKQTGTTMYATALYLIVDLARGEMRYATAAHPDALHVRRGRRSVEPLDSGDAKKGPALGLFEEAVFPTCRRPLAAGDSVLLFTDGLIEAEGADSDCFTTHRLTAAVLERAQLPTQELVSQLIAEIRSFCVGAEFGDDVAMLGMEVKSAG